MCDICEANRVVQEVYGRIYTVNRRNIGDFLGEYDRTIQSFDSREGGGAITADTVLGGQEGEGAAAMGAADDEAVDYVSIFGRMGENIKKLSKRLTDIWNGLTDHRVKRRIHDRYLRTMKSLLLPAISKTTSQRNYFYNMAIHQVYLLANNNGTVRFGIARNTDTKNIVERYFATQRVRITLFEAGAAAGAAEGRGRGRGRGRRSVRRALSAKEGRAVLGQTGMTGMTGQ